MLRGPSAPDRHLLLAHVKSIVTTSFPDHAAARRPSQPIGLPVDNVAVAPPLSPVWTTNWDNFTSVFEDIGMGTLFSDDGGGSVVVVVSSSATATSQIVG